MSTPRNGSEPPEANAAQAKPSPAAASTPAPAPSVPSEPVIRRPRTVYLDDPTWERARAVVAHMKYFDVPGQPDTLADLVEGALQVRLAELEADYGPFRTAGAKLGTGPGTQGRTRLSAPRKPRRPSSASGATSRPETPLSIPSET